VISHDRAQELISARMDAPLTPAEHHELQSHLASCAECRGFVLQADEVARELHAMPRLAPSPAVSRAVMAAVATDDPGWSWLRNALQALSSPGMAVASSLAVVVALASVLIVALNGPGGGDNREKAAAPKETIAAAVVTLPTEVPPTSTPAPTEAPVVVPTETARTAAPTATKPSGRTIELASPKDTTKTPTPRPTATAVPIVAAPAQSDQAVDSPPIEPSDGTYDAPTEEPVLAMTADGSGDGGTTADLAQAAAPVVDEAQPAASGGTGEAVDAAPSDSADAVATEPASTGRKNESGKKGNGEKSAPAEAPAAEPEPTRPVGPVPIEAIAALEGAGGAPNISLPPTPPGPLSPALPNQSFLPVTPTPDGGTPTPATESEVPQLADQWSDDLGLTALVPDNPAVVNAPNQTTSDSNKSKNNGKRDKESKAGNSHEEQQAAWAEAPMGWSSQPVEIVPLAAWQESTDQPVALQQETGYPTDNAEAAVGTSDPTATGEPGDAVTDDAALDSTDAEVEPQIDPATGMQIDPATGFLIDPTTGYLIDREHGRIIDPRTSYEVHPMTGLLIDPATGALLDPNTLEVVIPAGFGSDHPKYDPGSGDMRGQIEDVVQNTYDNATIKIEPPTDGPVQPVGEIVVPTESGDALELS
jgi:hypothetical protein